MKAERTIAIIGDTGDSCPALAKQLAGENVRLLFVSNDEKRNLEIRKKLGPQDPLAEIEFTTCEKDGCWEADVIAFTHPDTIEPNLITRIKEVATQKIVLVVSEKKDCQKFEGKINFEVLLPHSKVVNVIMDVENNEVRIFGKDEQAREMVNGFFDEAGYKIKKQQEW
jgi:predicted dinucleotide-binding enzyme